MGSKSVESVRLNGYIGNIWITEISIVSLFNFFVGVSVFITNVFFRSKMLLYVIDLNYIS